MDLIVHLTILHTKTEVFAWTFKNLVVKVMFPLCVNVESQFYEI